jgi:hypothetical protein
MGEKRSGREGQKEIGVEYKNMKRGFSEPVG